ncbi:ParA family protein, partial [Wenyingzhuangia sp. 1_MG-2023]|nr:ParA family protein [Wenyingzhuangia sp. 1_MG-2023]
SVADKRTARDITSDAIDMLGEDYELVVIDCPPILSPQIEGVLQAVDKILVPIEPSLLSIRAYEQSKQHLSWVKSKQWLPFVTLIDRRKRAHVQWASEVAPTIKELLPVFIGHSASAERMLELRSPIVVCQPNVPLARNYQALWDAVKEQLAF